MIHTYRAVRFEIVHLLTKGYFTQAGFREMYVLLCATVLLVVTALTVIVLYIISVAVL